MKSPLSESFQGRMLGRWRAACVLVILGFVFTGCVLPAKDENTEYSAEGQPIVETLLAQTVQARLEATSRASGSRLFYFPYISNFGDNASPAGAAAGDLTPTLIVDTATPTLTSTPVDTPTPTPAPCLLAKFVQDINVPPGTTFSGGTKFTKIWRVQNVGSCAWNSNFSLILVSGDLMGAKNQVPIGAVVQPGSNADLLVDFVAPKADGKYRGGWMIYNTSGQVFGVGSEGTDYLWVEIMVKNVGTSTAKTSTPTTKPTTKPSATTAPSSTVAPSQTATQTSTVTPTSTPTPTSTVTETTTGL
jgi:hypothetical protein